MYEQRQKMGYYNNTKLIFKNKYETYVFQSFYRKLIESILTLSITAKNILTDTFIKAYL